ncbi:PPC domain-containing DNA-binding protein [Piscinibacter sakaiensis]|uniref:PPC domain-containing protein n=1 Tax=Piscinibacter sakaiensis TaxID=1547922 RepID=A0A0K8NWJ0_PISS1|nr:PPC domain-containing DNA-binding protein [Piscinibacter sakaiensis]GAP34767.1 hypothetical protein ISF6_0166 [Piscinibacter sakaiensis]
MDTVALRLHPGDDLRLALEARARAEGWSAAFVVAGIGSLSQAALRLAGQPAALPWAGDLELLSLAGSLGPDSAHLHATVADATGAVRGGHVCAGCRVRTTLELLVALLPAQRFSRRHDPVTGYPELVVEPLVPGPFTGV